MMHNVDMICVTKRLLVGLIEQGLSSSHSINIADMGKYELCLECAINIRLPIESSHIEAWMSVHEQFLNYGIGNIIRLA